MYPIINGYALVHTQVYDVPHEYTQVHDLPLGDSPGHNIPRDQTQSLYTHWHTQVHEHTQVYDVPHECTRVHDLPFGDSPVYKLGQFTMHQMSTLNIHNVP